MNLTERFKSAFNVLLNKDQQVNTGPSTYISPSQNRLSHGNDRSIVASIYNQIAVDVASINIKHVRLGDNDTYLETIDSELNQALNISANIDQTGRQLIQDLVLSLFDEGVVALVPTHIYTNSKDSEAFRVASLRVAKIIDWYPKHVRVRVYNEDTGRKEDLVLSKDRVAIIENPLYKVMNDPNSTAKRLSRKLSLLDNVDELMASPKIDMIIQLPYTIRTEARKKEAKMRHRELENQLKNSKYGIGYIDATEKITQLNRPVDNNIINHVKYLTEMLFGQLGLSEAIFKGIADEQTMLNYYNRTIEPVISAITDEIKRKFLSKTAISQRQSIMFFRNPFKLVPVDKLADIADKFTRNEIMSSNEVRSIIGFVKSNDPKADELRNKNISQPEGEMDPSMYENYDQEESMEEY